jgi:outer membrane biosynthesis protein TonB
MAASNAPKRAFRDIWPHLVVSACALLLPPLGMAAGVMYLGSSHLHETATAAEPAALMVVAAEPARTTEPTPAVASVAPSPTEQRAAPEPQVAAVPAPPPAAATPPASAKTATTKDAAAKETATKDAAAKETAAKDAAPAPSAAPAAVAKVGESSEGTARAEAATPTETADAPAAPAANAQQSASGQKSRHDSRGRVRQARIPSITDIFMHPVRAR